MDAEAIPSCPNTRSRGISTVGAQQTAEPIEAKHRAVPRRCGGSMVEDHPVAQPLVRALQVIMRRVFIDQSAEVALPQRDDPAQAFRLDREHEPLGVSVKVGAPRREFHGLDPHGPQQVIEGGGEERIAVVDQVPMFEQKPVERVGQAAPQTEHPCPARVGRQAGDADAARRQVDHEEHVVPLQPACCPRFHGEEIRGRDGLPVCFEEERPGRVLAPFPRRLYAMLAQQVGDRGAGDPMA